LEILNKMFTNSEKKAYIKSQWQISSGSRITLMLKKYWCSKLVEENIKPTTGEEIENIFDGKLQ